MTEKHSPDSPVFIQARLRYLKEKKAILDEVIASLEHYAAYETSERRGPERAGGSRRLMGAA